MTTPTPDPATFRRVLSNFCSGIVVVTATDGAGPTGLTCQSFTSLSLDPPLVVFSVSRTSTSWPRVRSAGSFAVNILGAHQQAVSHAFATRRGDKFAGIAWTAGHRGAPLLRDAVAHIECVLEAVYDGGDHEIVLGRVERLHENSAQAEPLLYFRSRYRHLRPESA
ncbi:flavin reductase family protein [Dactylosporangium sp. NPDC051541]|uniref:flavin reductase family protein n=1 Tax=Dactylosporangium sp. NPDC051541 TaxID=3363977 RepID=UPI0037B416EE